MRYAVALILCSSAVISAPSFDPPTLRLGYGAAGEPVRRFYPGMTNVAVASLRLSAGAAEAVNLNSLSWNVSSFNTWVVSARLVHDTNANARVDAGEPTLAPAVLPPYPNPVTFTGAPLLTIPASSSRDLLLVVDITAADPGGFGLGVSLQPAPGSIGAVGQGSATPAVLSGARIDIHLNRAEDPFMVSLSGRKARFGTERHVLPNNGSVASFQWDFDNNGSFDSTHPTSPMADHVYAAPGPVTAVFRMNFVDGTFIQRTASGEVLELDPEIQTVEPDPAAPTPRTPSVVSIIGRPATGKLYALDALGAAVTELDAATGAVVARFSIDPGAGVNPGGIMAISEPHGRLYIFDEGYGFAVPHRLICVNLSTRTIEAVIPMPTPAFVDVMAINATTQRLYLTTGEASSILAVDIDPVSPTFHTIVASLNLRFNFRMVIKESANRMYVPVPGGGIHVIDLLSHEIVKTVNPPAFSGFLLDFVFNPVTGSIYMGFVKDGPPPGPPILVFDTVGEAFTASIPMPNSTKAIAVRTAPPSKTYAVLGSASGHHVKVIGAGGMVLSTIALSESHNAQEVTADLDQATGMLYLSVREDSGYSTRYVINTMTDTIVHSAVHTAPHILGEEKTEQASALFPALGRYWVAYEGSILVGYDTATHAAVATVSTLGGPGAVGFDPNDGKLVYTHSGPNGFRKADPLSGAQLMFAPTGPWTGVNYALNGGATWAYVLNYSGASKGLKAVRMSDGAVASIPLSPDAIVSGHLAVNPATQHLFVSMFKKSTGGFVAVVDVDPGSGTFNSELSVVNLGAGTQPQRLEVDPSTDKVYVAQGTGGTPAAFRIVDGAVAPTAALTLPGGGGWFNDGDLAVNPATQRAFLPAGDAIRVYDTTTDTLVGTIPVMLAVDVGLSVVQNRLYVRSEMEEDILVYDGTTLVQVATISPAGEVRDFLIADHLDRVYFPLDDEGEVGGWQVVQASTNQSLGVLADFDPASGFLLGSHPPGGRWSALWSSGPALTVLPTAILDRLKVFGPGGGDAMAPQITSVTGPSGAGQVGEAVSVSAMFDDDGTGHTAEWFWGDDTSSPGTITPTCGATSYEATGSHVYAAAGLYTITLFVRDGAGHESAAALTVAIVDPSAGFVTGGGWIQSPAGALVSDPLAQGQAHFSVSSQYKKGASIPTGSMKFDFKAGSFEVQGASQQWLVVSGSRAWLRGSGTLKDGSACAFQLTLVDGGSDRFRLRVWLTGSLAVVYDNQPGQPESGDASTPLGGGSVQIHGK